MLQRIFCTTKSNLFLDQQYNVKRNGFSITLGSILPDRTEVKYQNRFPNQSYIRRKLWPMSGGQQIESSITIYWTLVHPHNSRKLYQQDQLHASCQPWFIHLWISSHNIVLMLCWCRKSLVAWNIVLLEHMAMVMCEGLDERSLDLVNVALHCDAILSACTNI